MKRNDSKKLSNVKDSVSLDNSDREFQIFKSRVANAVLDYMEEQSDIDLLKCLEKSNMFLTNISSQMEKVFDNQTQAKNDQNDFFEIGDDLFSTGQGAGSNSIH